MLVISSLCYNHIIHLILYIMIKTETLLVELQAEMKMMAEAKQHLSNLIDIGWQSEAYANAIFELECNMAELQHELNEY